MAIPAYLKTEATCTAKAQYFYCCSCGAAGTETFEFGEMKDHVFGEWIVTKAPTCTVKGAEKRFCQDCVAYGFQSDLYQTGQCDGEEQ